MRICAVVDLVLGFGDGAKCGEADLAAACRNSATSVSVHGLPLFDLRNALLCEYREY